MKVTSRKKTWNLSTRHRPLDCAHLLFQSLCNLVVVHVSRSNVNDHFTNPKWTYWKSIGRGFRFCCVYISNFVSMWWLENYTKLHLVQFAHMLNTSQHKVLPSFWEKMQVLFDLYVFLSLHLLAHHLNVRESETFSSFVSNWRFEMK